MRKLTKPTANVFFVSTRANVQSAQLLLTEFNFSYALPGVFAHEALEKFFGQARQCSGGNFYTDAVDIKATATAETKNLHTPLKYDSTSQQPDDVACRSNICLDDDLFDIADTEELITSDATIKQKLVFLAGYLEPKFRSSLSVVEFVNEYNDEFDTAFLQNLDRGGLTVKLSTIHFVDSVQQVFAKMNIYCYRTRVSQILAHINSQIARVKPAFMTMSNILSIAFVLDKNDKE